MQGCPQSFVELRNSHAHVLCLFGMTVYKNIHPLFAGPLNINTQRCSNSVSQREPVGWRLEGIPPGRWSGAPACTCPAFADSVCIFFCFGYGNLMIMSLRQKKKIWTKDKIEPQHIYIYILSFSCIVRNPGVWLQRNFNKAIYLSIFPFFVSSPQLALFAFSFSTVHRQVSFGLPRALFPDWDQCISNPAPPSRVHLKADAEEAWRGCAFEMMFGQKMFRMRCRQQFWKVLSLRQMLLWFSMTRTHSAMWQARYS